MTTRLEVLTAFHRGDLVRLKADGYPLGEVVDLHTEDRFARVKFANTTIWTPWSWLERYAPGRELTLPLASLEAEETT